MLTPPVFACVSFTFVALLACILLFACSLKQQLAVKESYMDWLKESDVTQSDNCRNTVAKVRAGIAGGYGMGFYCDQNVVKEKERPGDGDEVCVNGEWVPVNS